LTFDARVFLPSECLIETVWPVLFGDEMDDAFNMPASVVVIESRPGTFLDGLLWDGGRVGPSSLDKDAVKWLSGELWFEAGDALCVSVAFGRVLVDCLDSATVIMRVLRLP
jgi:hypothetical protein